MQATSKRVSLDSEDDKIVPEGELEKIQVLLRGWESILLEETLLSLNMKQRKQ